MNIEIGNFEKHFEDNANLQGGGFRKPLDTNYQSLVTGALLRVPGN